MKKTMRMMIAVLMAIACFPTAAVHAEDGANLWYWGSADLKTFSSFEKVDTGEFLGTVYADYIDKGREDENGNVATENQVNLYRVTPKENDLTFTLREGLNPEENFSEVLDIIDKYYPGAKTAWNPDYPSIRIDDGINVVAEPSRRGYAIYDERDLAEKTEIANAIMHDLAANGLITEFYGWGQTASYSNPIATPAILYYPNCYESNDELYLTDLDKVKNYLKENHAECEVVMEESDSSKEPDLKKPAYHITVPETMTARDEFMLAIELYQNLGISARFFEFNSASGSLVGHNAMERPGDTNLDCEVDILDVIAANKHILGVGTLDKTGLKNADMDGNGTADSADSLAILKAALDIDG